MIAEGLVSYFESVSVSARDRFFRAYLVSTLTRDADLGRLASAWVAHVDFDQGAYETAFEYLGKAFSGLDRTEYSTLARVGLILGDAYLYLGERAKAQFWYERARHAAVDEGDQAAIGALMYNRSAFGSSRLALEKFAFDTEPDEQLLRFCEMELDSAWEFQKGTNVRSLFHLVDLCRAKICILQRRFVDAKKLLAHNSSKMSVLEDRPNRNQLSVELAYCQYMSGDESGAKSLLEGWSLSEIEKLDVDDKLVAIGMLQVGLHDVASHLNWFAGLGDMRAASIALYESECELIRVGLDVLDCEHKERFDLRVSK
jgi:tetratricopeptide (TPR) repeat protein